MTNCHVSDQVFTPANGDTQFGEDEVFHSTLIDEGRTKNPRTLLRRHHLVENHV